jgi:hypothetical protein
MGGMQRMRGCGWRAPAAEHTALHGMAAGGGFANSWAASAAGRATETAAATDVNTKYANALPQQPAGGTGAAPGFGEAEGIML